MIPPVLLPDMLGNGPLTAAVAAFAPSVRTKTAAAETTRLQRITTPSRTQLTQPG
jgi:hypothetical protein